MPAFKTITLQSDRQSSIISEIQTEVKKAVGNLTQRDLVLKIADWQSGDFGHVFAAMRAAIIRHQTVVVVVLNSGKFNEATKNDFFFCLEGTDSSDLVNVHLFVTTSCKKDRLKGVLGDEGYMMQGSSRVLEPFMATFMAVDLIEDMKPGTPLNPVWAAIVRGEKEGQTLWKEDFAECAQALIQQLNDCKRIVCVWARTSGKRVKIDGEHVGEGGANPQFDSSKAGNHQICVELSKNTDSATRIVLIGKGFYPETKNIDKVVDFGEFWKNFKRIKGRFQENGFFDFLSATFGVSVVHVGMKSGGMDILGLWGQHAVFIDDEHANDIPKARVEAWAGPTLHPIRVNQLPTLTGNIISAQQTELKIRTQVSAAAWKAIDTQKEFMRLCGDEYRGFNESELSKICRTVIAHL